MTPQDLVEIEQIKQLKARYFRCMDEKRWKDWGECFTEDARFDVSGEAPDGRFTGRDKMVEYTGGAVADAITVHHGHMPEIELTGPEAARGVWSMEDYLEFPSETGGESFTIHGRGHYHEEYRKGSDGSWRIDSLKLTRLWIRHAGPPPTRIAEMRDDL